MNARAERGRKRRRQAAWLGALLTLWACSGNRCGAGPEHLAELQSQQGEVERDLAAAIGSFRAAHAGDRFAVGDGLRTGPGGTATLALVPEGLALVEPNTLLRFLDRDPRGGEQRMAVESGRLEVSSGGLELDVHTPRGMARLAQGARVRILVGRDRALQLDVLVGRVALDQAGVARALVAGDRVELAPAPAQGDAPRPAARQPGGAMASDADEPGADPLATGGVDPLAASGFDAGTPEVEELAPTARAPEWALPALENATLHARTVPLSVRLAALPGCASAPRLELNGRTLPGDPARGWTFAIETLGKHRVRVRCDGRIRASSVLRVVPESAAELPKRAPRVDVEADGRRYTVRYQNVVPVVRASWTTAPAASAYTLVLRQDKRERRIALRAPSHDFATGSLGPGQHEFSFIAAQGQRSATSSLHIELDESARALTLSEPADGSAAEGVATVSGLALLRSRVSANGVALPLDDKGRFRAQVPLPHSKTVLVRAAHGAVGVHYYLRRLR